MTASLLMGMLGLHATKEHPNAIPCIFLVRNGRRLAKPAHAPSTYPAFDPDEYPLAPFTWKAPYTYTAGEVCWSLQEILEAGSQPGSRPAIEPGMEIEGATQRIMAQATV